MRNLVKLSDTADFIIDGKAVCDLYNTKGGLYAIKGTLLPKHRQRVEFFVRSADFALFSKQDPAQEDTTRLQFKKMNLSEYKNVMESFISKETIELYNRLISDLTDVFSAGLNGVTIIDFAEDIIEKTFNENRVDLYLCNKAFSSFNIATARHSLSVYLLFCEVMFDFRKQSRDLPFYTTFKQRGKKINFSSDQIRKYALGALLHDIGKIKIPEELLEKPTPLTNEEMELMQQHSRFGIEILDEAGEYSPEIREMVGNHHQATLAERKDRINTHFRLKSAKRFCTKISGNSAGALICCKTFLTELYGNSNHIIKFCKAPFPECSRLFRNSLRLVEIKDRKEVFRR